MGDSRVEFDPIACLIWSMVNSCSYPVSICHCYPQHYGYLFHCKGFIVIQVLDVNLHYNILARIISLYDYSCRAFCCCLVMWFFECWVLICLDADHADLSGEFCIIYQMCSVEIGCGRQQVYAYPITHTHTHTCTRAHKNACTHTHKQIHTHTCARAHRHTLSYWLNRMNIVRKIERLPVCVHFHNLFEYLFSIVQSSSLSCIFVFKNLWILFYIKWKFA